MKNTIYAVVIAVCILGAVVVFIGRRGGGGAGLNDIADSKMIWVKCTKCNQGYEMGEKQFYKESMEKMQAKSGQPMAMPLTCQKCGKDGIVRAYKCENEKCGEIFRAGSVQGDYEDRCPKCKHSAIEASRKARLGQQ
jgi:phage FluMu protein Com